MIHGTSQVGNGHSHLGDENRSAIGALLEARLTKLHRTQGRRRRSKALHSGRHLCGGLHPSTIWGWYYLDANDD